MSDCDQLEFERNLYERAYRVLLTAITSIGYANPSLEDYLRNNGVEPSLFGNLTDEFKYLRTLDVEIAEIALGKSNDILRKLHQDGS